MAHARSRTVLAVAAVLAVGEAACDRTPAPAPIPPAMSDTWFSGVPKHRAVARAPHAMVATSQPLATRVGLNVLERGGNAVDAAIAVAAMLNVTEPPMTGMGGDMFAMVYWANTGTLSALNASGRAPRALTLAHFLERKRTEMPMTGMEPITTPGAVDGWVTLRDRFGTRPLAELLAPAIAYAEQGFPVAETIAEDWALEVGKLASNDATAATYLVDGKAPIAGAIFKQPRLAKTLRTLAAGGRDAFYKGPIANAIVAYVKAHGGYLTLEDFAAQAGSAEWVDPISTTYKGYTLYELPPNNQGLTALILANILEGIDLRAMRSDPVLYYHTLIESTKIAFADRNRYIADPAATKAPVAQLIAKPYATERRRLIDPARAIDVPAPGAFNTGSDTTYFTIVDKDRNAVSFINSIFSAFGSGIVAGDTGIMLHNRGSGFSLDPNHPNRFGPGKRPFHTLIPAMVFKDGRPWLSYGVMGGDIQAQGHVQVLINLVDRGLNLQQAVDAPRVRYIKGREVMMEPELGDNVIAGLVARGHQRALPPVAGAEHRTFMGGGQAIMIDPVTGVLSGASDRRKDGLALGY